MSLEISLGLFDGDDEDENRLGNILFRDRQFSQKNEDEYES